MPVFDYKLIEALALVAQEDDQRQLYELAG